MIDVLSDSSNDSRYNGKTLSERLTGRFYTPEVLADELAIAMVGASSSSPEAPTISATDPFCGDGRLIVALLRAAVTSKSLRSSTWLIELRDRDAAAVKAARVRILAAATALGIKAHVKVFVGDSFEADLSARFNLVITNPPWELLKPDSREMIHMTADDAVNYRTRLKVASDRLNQRFPHARGEGAWGGWGTNLARCGWDLCLKICRANGVVGIVLPSTILADQSSLPMREAAFSMNRVVDIAAFPSEARLFDKVDQPVIAMTMLKGRASRRKPRLRLYGADRTLGTTVDLELQSNLMISRGWSIPVGFGASAGSILGRLAGFDRLVDLEGVGSKDLWLGRELDETRIEEKTTLGSEFPFVKGRMVRRHSVVEQPTSTVRSSLCDGFHSIRHPRAVWRDVSRASQRRRMIGTVIPAGWVAGNSLHVACFRDGNPERTLALHALLSSFVVELQVRTRLATGHMSLGIVRQVHIPILTSNEVKRLAKVARAALVDGDGSHAADALEVAVARSYGLDRSSMISILENFPKVDSADRERLTGKNAWT
jgi:Alw26I/Eco31I/Esp3I family type II restriction m6 adenine DNA methyltransferase